MSCDAVELWCRNEWRDTQSKYNKQMTPRETLRLNAWEKWTRYRRPPWKFIINFAIVICTTATVIVLNQYASPYNRAASLNWQSMLSPPSVEGAAGGVYPLEMGAAAIYSVDALMASFKQTTFVYYNLQNYSVDYFEYVRDGNNQIVPIQMDVTTFDGGAAIFDLNSDFSGTTTTDTYTVDNSGSVGPFTGLAGKALASFVHTINWVTLRFSVKNYEFAGSSRSCFQWNIVVDHDFSVRGRIDWSTSATTVLCPEEASVPWYKRSRESEVFLFIALIVLASVNQLLHFRSIYHEIVIFLEVKRTHSYHTQIATAAAITLGARSIVKGTSTVSAAAVNAAAAETLAGEDEPVHIEHADAPHSLDHNFSWDELSFSDKLRFFNGWFFIASVGNLCNIVGPVLSIRQQQLGQHSLTARLTFIGLGCMMSYLSMVQYFEGINSYYVLVTTLTKGTPRVIRFLFGVFPVFLGYAMFGVAFFSPTSENFSTVDQACVTLFALLNGDVIHDTFDQLYPAHPFISRVYLYTFIALFIYVVLNIFIAIVEDAFFASKAFQVASQSRLEDATIATMDPLALLDTVPLPSFDDQKQSNTNKAAAAKRKASIAAAATAALNASAAASDQPPPPLHPQPSLAEEKADRPQSSAPPATTDGSAAPAASGRRTTFSRPPQTTAGEHKPTSEADVSAPASSAAPPLVYRLSTGTSPASDTRTASNRTISIHTTPPPPTTSTAAPTADVSVVVHPPSSAAPPPTSTAAFDPLLHTTDQ